VGAPSVPGLPEDGPTGEPPAVKLELTVPEVPNVVPETQLPPVEVPQVELPPVESVTESVTGSLTDSLR
jgi:hypothetical protein